MCAQEGCIHTKSASVMKTQCFPVTAAAVRHTAGANHASRQSDAATNNAVNNKMGPVMLINVTQSTQLAFAAAPNLASDWRLFELSCLAPSFTVMKGRNFLCRTNKYFLS